MALIPWDGIPRSLCVLTRPKDILPHWFPPVFLVILALGLFVRLYAIDRVPPGLWYDEAIYALDAVDTMTAPKIFYDTQNHMREPLYIWGLGAWFQLSDITVVAARSYSALLGWLTLVLTLPYLAVFFRPSNQSLRAILPWILAGLLAMATLRWSVHFSRTIFRAMMVPLFIMGLSLAWYYWALSLRHRWAVLTGFILGLGAYTYLSWRLVPFLVITWTVAGIFQGNLNWRKSWQGFLLTALTALVVSAPLAWNFVLNPHHFSGRTAEVSLLWNISEIQDSEGESQEIRTLKPLGEILRSLSANLLRVALMWNIIGDHVGKHNLPNWPIFDPFNGLVFLLGLGWLLVQSRKSLTAMMAITTLVVMSLASVLSFGAPNILRTQALIPVTILCWTAGLWLVFSWASAKWKNPTIAVTLAVSLGTTLVVVQLASYFVGMPRSRQVRMEFQTDAFYLPAQVALELYREPSPPNRFWVPQELAFHPTFRFVSLSLPHIETYPAEGWPENALLPGDAVLTTVRSLQLAANSAGRNLRRELTNRPDSRSYRTLTILPPQGPAQPYGEWTRIIEKRP